jgi:hypothetical protein
MNDEKSLVTNVKPVPEQQDLPQAPPDVNPQDEGSIGDLPTKNKEQTETKSFQ